MCKCEQPPFHYKDFETVYLGEDDNFASVTIDRCRLCGQKWLKYLVEEEYYTKSGRWWRVPVGPDKVETLTANNAKAFIASSKWCFGGGSFYDGKIHLTEAPIRVF